MAKVQRRGKRRVKKNIARGCAHIHSTFNNTIVTITDESGNAVAWSSAGALGFQGKPKEHTVCGTASRRSSRKGCNGSRDEDGQRGSKRTGTGTRSSSESVAGSRTEHHDDQ